MTTPAWEREINSVLQRHWKRNQFRTPSGDEEVYNPTNFDSDMMIKILGNYIETLPEAEEYLMIGFSPSSLPLKKRWQNNGISADFMADYLRAFFISKYAEASQEENMLVENLKSAVRYIGNELLKFQDEKTACAAKIFLSLYQEKLVFQIRNGCNIEQANNFQTFIEQKLLVGNPRQLYLEALRNSAKRGENAPSQVGLLSMIGDYSAQLGWKFEPGDADSSFMVISTTVCLTIP